MTVLLSKPVAPVLHPGQRGSSPCRLWGSSCTSVSQSSSEQGLFCWVCCWGFFGCWFFFYFGGFLGPLCHQKQLFLVVRMISFFHSRISSNIKPHLHLHTAALYTHTYLYKCTRTCVCMHTYMSTLCAHVHVEPAFTDPQPWTPP